MFSRMLRFVQFALLVSASLALPSLALATAPTLPETGVDLVGLIGAAITAMGLIVVVTVGGYFAFLIIKKGLRWAGRAIG